MIPQLKKLLREREVVKSAGVFSFIKLHNGYAYRNPKVSFIAFDGAKPFLFLKTVRKPKDSEVIRHAHDRLERAYAWVGQAKLPVRMPIPKWSADVGSVVVSAETIVHGHPLRPSDKKGCAEAFRLLEAWTKAGMRNEHDAIESRPLVARVVDEMRFGDPVLREEVFRSFEEALDTAGGDSVRISRIPSHGDCTPGNLVLDRAEGLGLIDWDRFGDIEVPLFDLLTFVQRLARDASNPFVSYRSEIDRHVKNIGCDMRVIPLLLFYYAIFTEWRKRLRFHPCEIDRMDQGFKAKLATVMKWATEYRTV